MSDSIERTLGRIEGKLDSVIAEHDDLKEAVQVNTRFRWRATAVGSFCIAILGWFGLIR